VQSQHRIGYPILSDPGNEYSKRLGLVYELPASLKQLYQGFGIDLEACNGDASWTLPLAARLVVARDGTLADIATGLDYTRRPEPEESLEILETLA